MTRKYEYNKANLITGVTNTNNKNVKTSYRYSYYPDGNIAHYVNHYNATMDYTYDSANRVVKEVYGEDAGTPFTIDYIYDEFGNLSKKNYGDEDSPAYIKTYSYDKNNRLTKESQVINDVSAKWQNITTYGYDKNGNRLNRVEYKNKNVDSNKFNLGMIDVGSNSKGTGYKYSDYGKEVYTYDGLNELKSYRGKDEQNATYEYMPNHYRISKTVDGTKTYQLWDNDRVVSELDSELNLKINYRIGVNGQILSDSNENSYSYDGHGNLVNGKDNSSTTVYDAYGNKTEDIGIGDAPFGYCGEYTDSESGLVYLRNRYYDPSTGSFITEDPIKDGNNWYGYCAGNPVNGWDPSGLFGENTILSEQKNNSMRDVIKVQQVLSKQKLLDARYTYGIYDEYTVKAVNLYKDKNKLTNTGECYGKVGKTTWEHMGLKIDNKYEVSNSVINGNSESDGLFASFTGMNIKNGLNIISGSAGLAEIKNKVHNMEFSINIGNINADVGATKEYVGADVSASLYSMGGKVEVPIPLTEHKLVLKGTGYVGGVGVATKIDLKNKKILVKSIAVIGEGVEIGVD